MPDHPVSPQDLHKHFAYSMNRDAKLSDQQKMGPQILMKDAGEEDDTSKLWSSSWGGGSQ